MKFLLANRITQDGRRAASHLGLFCLPLSHKKDVRHILVQRETRYRFTMIVLNCCERKGEGLQFNFQSYRLGYGYFYINEF